MRARIFSLQTKLLLALSAVIMLSLAVAGAVFVVQDRDNRRDQALSRVAGASPAIYQQALVAVFADQSPGEDESFVEDLKMLADDQDVRILIVTRDGEVLFDTEERLGGENVEIPSAEYRDFQRGFVSWDPPADFPEKNLTFISAPSRLTINGGREVPFRIVLAVRSNTIADAWRGVLPGLGLAAVVAIPVAALAAAGIARQVAQPVERLTEASSAMARGDFDQRVEINRDDEIGRLARSFSTMAERVGERDTQMRELLANVSHDLKTPMTSITGYAQSLGDGTAGPEDVARIAGIIQEEAEHVNAMLADLLYLGEIDAGQTLMHRADAPLDDIVARCLRRIEPVAHARGIAIDGTGEGDITLHNVDAEKVERALTNVLANAAKFTPPGGRIEVAAARNGTGAVVTVANTSDPIADEDLARLFDRFFRGDRARRTSSGSGLGLAITRELIELNDGTIAARNTDDGRVAFDIRLPATGAS